VRRSRRGRDQGFTLLELVFALAVGVLLMLLAAQLLRTTQLVFLDATRDALDPQPRLGAALLRHDVRAALVVSGGSLLPSTGALDLLQPGSNWIRYEREDAALVRLRLASDGTELGRLVVMRPVGGWWWRETVPGLLEISLSATENAMDRSLLASGPERLAASGRPIEVHFFVTPRVGRPGF